MTAGEMPPIRFRSAIFLALAYGALYAAYGSQSPFLPSLFAQQGAGASQIGTLLAVGIAVRIVAGPMIGSLADRWHARRLTLAACAAVAGIASVALTQAVGFAVLLVAVGLHAVATSALAPVADAVALSRSREGGFSYGWLRGLGSAAFVAGTLLAAELIGNGGVAAAIVASGVAFLAMSVAIALVPSARRPDAATRHERGSILEVLRDRRLLLLTLTASLVLGSHSLNDTFAILRWREAGIGTSATSLLWSAAVLSEVVVFTLVGPPLVARLGPGRALIVSALAGAARWCMMALTIELPALAVAQAGHGLTFGLLHLAAMRLIQETVPPRLGATAQTLYGTFGLGLASAALTLAGGFLYGRLGGEAYWVMAALCLLALAPASALAREPGSAGRGPGARPG